MGLVRPMKDSLSSFDVHASVKDLQALAGGYLDKIYHPSLDHLVLTVRTPGGGKVFVHFHVGHWLFKTEKSGEMPQEPSDFARMLRKRIAGARITSVKQQGFDRIAVLSLEKEEKYELVLELFAEGNVILVKDDVIVQPLTSRAWKYRDVRAKKPFRYPPPVPDPMTISADDLLTIVRSSDTDLVRTIATKLNTGGRYSEEICARSGLDKATKAKELDDKGSSRILEAIRALRKEIAESGKGYVVTKDFAIEDVVPVRMRIYNGLSHQEFETFSAAVESYIERLPKPKKEKPNRAQVDLEKLRRKLAQQEAAAMKLQDQARETQIVGDFIFGNYGEVSRVLAEANRKISDSEDLKELPGFVSYDRRNARLTVRIESAQIELDLKEGVEGNARRHYENAKKARKKLEGVIAALAEARRELDQYGKVVVEESETPERREPTKRLWFERFRWFVSSEGAIVLGGKDAKGNDLLVKKHLDAGDRYAHADVHGAPSVVVKMREGITEQTLHEACEFAVATSRAWSAKIGSAAGYWVLPEQVSKTPQSGEYLAKGAFVIRGKRNYSDKLEIKLGVGEIEFEGNRKIMCGPERAIKACSKKFVIIRPGEKNKDAVAKQLSDVFEVPIEEIQSVMPPGDVEIVEQVGVSIS